MPRKEKEPVADVRVGQVWQDWDTRYRPHGRKIKITEVQGRFAHAVCIADMTVPGYKPLRSSVGKTTRIAIERMRPTANGYKLVEEAP